MKKRTAILASVISLVFASAVVAEDAGMMSPLMPAEKVEAMKKMMMEMQPDTLDASIKRGEKLFNDNTLGKNSTGT
ncbi:MAG: hypothetical protein HZB83_05645, partial [Deltaproteobacteria bacterium]|nr:hypothetical protein [Deltaproteobacteria bacterium]